MALSSLVRVLPTGQACVRHTQRVEAWAQWPGRVCPRCRLSLLWLVRVLTPPQRMSSGGVWSVVATEGSVVSFPTEGSAWLGAAGGACMWGLHVMQREWTNVGLKPVGTAENLRCGASTSQRGKEEKAGASGIHLAGSIGCLWVSFLSALPWEGAGEQWGTAWEPC